MDSCLIRADASSRMGTGHVMRCLALAQALQSVNRRVVFLLAQTTPALEQRLRAEGLETDRLDVASGSLEDAVQTAALARANKVSWIVADGYQFGAAWQQHIRQSGLRLLFVDDYGHAGHYYADSILNQNLAVDPALYDSRDPATKLLLGPQYALLRSEYFPWRLWKREVAAVARKVLLTLGGADPDNVTARVIQALTGLPELEVLVVVGGSNPYLESIRSAINVPQPTFRLVVNTSNMSELMAWADVAIAAGGITPLELAFMGLPCLLVVLADNQRDVSAQFDAAGMGRNLGWHGDVQSHQIAAELHQLLLDQPARERMSRCGRRFVDGLGARRVASLLAPAREPVGTDDCITISDLTSA